MGPSCSKLVDVHFEYLLISHFRFIITESGFSFFFKQGFEKKNVKHGKKVNQ